MARPGLPDPLARRDHRESPALAALPDPRGLRLLFPARLAHPVPLASVHPARLGQRDLLALALPAQPDLPALPQPSPALLDPRDLREVEPLAPRGLRALRAQMALPARPGLREPALLDPLVLPLPYRGPPARPVLPEVELPDRLALPLLCREPPAPRGLRALRARMARLDPLDLPPPSPALRDPLGLLVLARMVRPDLPARPEVGRLDLRGRRERLGLRAVAGLRLS